MSDLIDRLRIYASTRKGELADLITEAADALERQTCEDAVSRQQAIDALCNDFCGGHHDCKHYPDCGNLEAIQALPSVQPQPEEDCDTCKHGFFGDRQCDNCRVRYPSHYEREEEHNGSD